MKIIGRFKLCCEPALIGLNTGVKFGCFQSASEIAGRGRFHVDYSYSIWLLSTGSMLITEGDPAVPTGKTSSPSPRSPFGSIVLANSFSTVRGVPSARRQRYIRTERATLDPRVTASTDSTKPVEKDSL